MSIFKSKICALIFFLCLYCFQAHALEYINDFRSSVEVKPDGSLLITETISIYHEGIEIKRGICRDLPTSKGERYDILYVLRNGAQEPWIVETKDFTKSICTGTDELLESPALSEYTISYIMYDALRQIKNSNLNELYLNITGKWSLPINHLNIDIRYPPETEIKTQYSYITDQDKTQYTPGTEMNLTDIAPHHEVTIAQSFVKGTVHIPLPKYWFWSIIGLIATLLYFLIVWVPFGKDPKPNPIVPDWDVPQNLSPLECAYLDKNGARPSNAFFLHILWLLNQKILNISEQEAPAFLGKKKTYTLTVQNQPQKIKDKEAELYLRNYPNVLTLTSAPQQKVTEYAAKLYQTIEKRLEKKYYKRRNFITIIGALIFPLIWLNFFPETAGALYCLAIFILPQIMSRTLIGALFIAITITVLLFTFTQNVLLTEIFGAYLLLIALFQHLMFQPTLYGQREKEKIAGIKMFLTTITENNNAQKEDSPSLLKRLSKDKRLTPEDMEHLFPYAVALGIEKDWEKKYAAFFGATALTDFMTSRHYTAADFQTRLNDSCNQVTSYSSHESSGIGSSGGGFAGGGFGGGGGHGR